MVSDAMYQGEDTDHLLEEEEGRPRPMAGFRVALVSSKRKAEDVPEDEPPVSGMRRTVSAPPVLAPMAEVMSSSFGPPEDDNGCVYFPVSVDLDSLVDWKEARQGREENNNEQAALQKAALVNVNNKEVAVFKYGQEVIATASRCPHAGGPLHLGDIEVLPDRSLCVRCPWHRWAFKLQGPGGQGDCVFPPGRDEKKLQLYPTVRVGDTGTPSQGKRKQIKIGFDSFDTFNLINETF